MNTGIAIALVGSVAAVLTLWIGPLMWLAQKIDAQRNHLDSKIDGVRNQLSEQQRASDSALHEKLDRLIFHLMRERSKETQP